MAASSRGRLWLLIGVPVVVVALVVAFAVAAFDGGSEPGGFEAAPPPESGPTEVNTDGETVTAGGSLRSSSSGRSLRLSCSSSGG